MSTEERSWSDLPNDLVELVASKLELADHASFMCSCKNWCSVMRTSIKPVYPLDICPLLLHSVGLDDGIYRYFSPFFRSAFEIDFPFNFPGYEFLFAKDGLLLLCDHLEMMLADPFTGHSILIPGWDNSIYFNGVAVGSHNGNYIIFLIYADVDVVVNIHDQRGWQSVSFWDNEFSLAPSSNPAYLDGLFYCLGANGCLGVFDPLDLGWNILDAEFNEFDENSIHDTYLAESNNTLIVAQIEKHGDGIHIFSLDRGRMLWEEIFELGNRSLFLGSRMSLVSVPKTRNVQNRVFLARFHKEPKAIKAEFSLSDGRPFLVSKSLPGGEIDETMVSCFNLTSGGRSDYFGPRDMLFSIWFEP